MADSNEKLNEAEDEVEDVSHPEDTYSHRSFDNSSMLSLELSDVSMFNVVTSSVNHLFR